LMGFLKSGDQSIRLNLEEFEKIDNIYIVLPLAGHYLMAGTKGKFDWFKQKLQKGSPRIVFNLMGLFMNYALKMPEAQREEAKAILKNIAENHRYEQIRSQAQIYLDEFNE